MILNELIQVSDVKYYTFAPENKEVEELTRKELVAALQQRKPIEEYIKQRQQSTKQRTVSPRQGNRSPDQRSHAQPSRDRKQRISGRKSSEKNNSISRPHGPQQLSHAPRDRTGAQNARSKGSRTTIPKQYSKWVKQLVSSNMAVGLDKEGNEVLRDSNVEFIKNLNGNVETLILDGVVTQRLLEILEEKNIKNVIAVNYSRNLKFKDPNAISLYYFSDFL